jgi:uncharacterized membrane protein YdbT with pleckstrin-like domain
MAEQEEVELYRSHPAMFREHPFWFFLSVLLIAVFGVGLVILLIWWINVLGTTLIVTNKRLTLRKGIFSKSTNDVFHSNIRNIQVYQSLINRILNVGRPGISTPGQADIEIEVAGMRDPDRIKEIIDQYHSAGARR